MQKQIILDNLADYISKKLTGSHWEEIKLNRHKMGGCGEIRHTITDELFGTYTYDKNGVAITFLNKDTENLAKQRQNLLITGFLICNLIYQNVLADTFKATIGSLQISDLKTEPFKRLHGFNTYLAGTVY